MSSEPPETTHQAAPQTRSILGVRFFAGTVEKAIETASRGGLIVCPSGPGMSCDLLTDESYRRALATADIALTDSALMVMAHNLFSGEKVPRISGLKLLRAVLDGPRLREPGSSFWVFPNESERDLTLAWLASNGIPVNGGGWYIAPRYGPGPIEDPALLGKIQQTKARWVILCIGGGVQERLGLYLRDNLSPHPAILCIGAAIAFLTGAQANIPPWADRFYLGWFLRCIHKPSSYIPRYWRSRGLPWLVWKYKDKMPPLMKMKNAE